MYIDDEAIRLLLNARKEHPFNPYLFPSPSDWRDVWPGLRRQDPQEAAEKIGSYMEQVI